MARKMIVVTAGLVAVAGMVTLAAWGGAEALATTSYSYWVQVASHASGLAGSQWRTDVGVNNPNAATANVEVRFYPAGGGTTLTQTTFVPAGAQSLLTDVVGQLGGSGSGALEVRSDRPVVVTSRTYNAVPSSATCTPGGTFGQYYAAYATEQGLAAGATAIVAHLLENAAFRSNLAFTNTGTSAASVKVELFDGAGGKLGEFTVSLNPGQYKQETQVFKNRAGQTNLARGYARVSVLSGAGVLASGSVVDNRTNDPTTIPCREVAPAAEELTIMLPGNVPLVLVKIPKGTFTMGSPEGERGRASNETEHQVTLTQDYFLGKYEVTQRQWQAVIGAPMPSECGAWGVGDDHPVYCVSWNEVCGGATGSTCSSTSFIGRLNAYLAATGQPGAGKLRLPTEAEWERAARGGTTGPFSFDTSANPSWDLECGSFPQADASMWWCNNAGSAAHPVGQKLPNPYGLFDMHGNAWEWVGDWFGSYPAEAVADPTGPETGSRRVFRGGSGGNFAKHCRSAFRNMNYPDVRLLNVGLRVAASS